MASPQTSSNLSGRKLEAVAARFFPRPISVVLMDARLKEWKSALDALWSASTLDDRAAARLVADLAHAEEPELRDAAAQALPSLRAACFKTAGRSVHELARRRMGVVRDVLHALTGPRFGRRRTGPEVLTADEQRRRMLGLPFGRRLFGPEINQAFKRAAKKAHPDAGGSERAFLELAAAREALMKGL
jgi:hypothetical protein